MKKIIVSSVIGSMLCFTAFCQKGVFSIGVGPSHGLPVSNSNFSYYWKNALGGSMQAQFGLTKLGSIVTNVSIINSAAKNLPITSSATLKLIKVGYRTNFLNSGFFVGTDAGLAQYGSGSSHFVVGGTVGYTFKISKGSYIDLFPTFNNIFRTGFNKQWLITNVIVRFDLNKKKLK